MLHFMERTLNIIRASIMMIPTIKMDTMMIPNPSINMKIMVKVDTMMITMFSTSIIMITMVQNDDTQDLGHNDENHVRSGHNDDTHDHVQGGERIAWEFHHVTLQRVPGYGFGIAVSVPFHISYQTLILVAG